jgi:serine/threonine protein kinase
MSFRPSVNSKIALPTGEYHFTEHPAAKGMPYGQTGRRATVYQMRNSSGFHALKVFANAFRTFQVETGAQRIRVFASLPGLQVCARMVLTRQNHANLLGQYPDLEYAALMPWVGGQTWQEIMLSRQPLSPEKSLALARKFSFILSTMEQNGLAHCDLSGPNLLVSGEDVELVDVEDMYAPGLEKPVKLPGGSAGYGHKTAAQGLWCAEADRFAGSVLLAEMLGWCDERVRRIAAGEQYFDVSELQSSCDRYNLLIAVLRSRYNIQIADLLTNAWHSETLAACPTLEAWQSILGKPQPTSPSAVPVPTASLPTFKPSYLPLKSTVSSPVSVTPASNSAPLPASHSPKVIYQQKPASPLSWVLVVLLGLVSIALGISLSSTSSNMASYRSQYYSASAAVDAQATSLAEVQNSLVGLNYFRVTLNDFYNQASFPVKNTQGVQIGEIIVGYSWFYGENDKPTDKSSLVTLVIKAYLNGDPQPQFIGFATTANSKYAVEERNVPSIGMTKYIETR